MLLQLPSLTPLYICARFNMSTHTDKTPTPLSLTVTPSHIYVGTHNQCVPLLRATPDPLFAGNFCWSSPTPLRASLNPAHGEREEPDLILGPEILGQRGGECVCSMLSAGTIKSQTWVH